MKKKRTSLPRLTVLAYSKRDLATFVQAVENLRLIAQDLGTFVGTLKAKLPVKKPTTKTYMPDPDAMPNGTA